MRAAALTCDDLPHLSPRACRAANALYAREPLELDGWHWRFERQSPSLPACRVTLVAGAPEANVSVVLLLHSRASQFEWWKLNGDARLLAFSAAHARLLALLGGLLGSVPLVTSVDHGQCPPDDERVGADFAVTDERSVIRSRGRAYFAPHALPETAAGRKARAPWNALDAHLRVILGRVRVSVDDLGRIERGALVRFAHGQNGAPDTVTLDAAGRPLLARAQGRRLQILSGFTGEPT